MAARLGRFAADRIATMILKIALMMLIIALILVLMSFTTACAAAVVSRSPQVKLLKAASVVLSILLDIIVNASGAKSYVTAQQVIILLAYQPYFHISH